MASVTSVTLARKVAGEAKEKEKQLTLEKRLQNCPQRLVSLVSANINVNIFVGAQPAPKSGPSLESPPRPLSCVHGKLW